MFTSTSELHAENARLKEENDLLRLRVEDMRARSEVADLKLRLCQRYSRRVDADRQQC